MLRELRSREPKAGPVGAQRVAISEVAMPRQAIFFLVQLFLAHITLFLPERKIGNDSGLPVVVGAVGTGEIPSGISTVSTARFFFGGEVIDSPPASG